MTIERAEPVTGATPNGAKGFLGSLKDALLAASRDELPVAVTPPATVKPAKLIELAALQPPPVALPAVIPRAEDAARLARTMPVPVPRPVSPASDRHREVEAPPTTRVVRRDAAAVLESNPDRTVLLRGRQKIERVKFERDPVVGFLVVVGGPGLGAFRPVFEGNNTVGRSTSNRVAIDFGDDTISSEAQAYIRYDATDRSFLFVPNLAKTNVVSVNDKRPAGAVELKAMDVITLGRTQVALLPFCGSDFDWSEISESKD